MKFGRKKIIQGGINSSFLPQTNPPTVSFNGRHHGYIHGASEIAPSKVVSRYSSNTLFQCFFNKASDFSMLFPIGHDIRHSIL